MRVVLSSAAVSRPLPIPGTTMRSLTFVAALVFAGFAVAQDKKDPPAKKDAPVVPPRTGESKTIKLFDGKTLDGWEGYTDLWSVKEGVIVAKNTEPLKYSTYLLTKGKYTDFRLTFSAKLVTSEMHSASRSGARCGRRPTGR